MKNIVQKLLKTNDHAQIEKHLVHFFLESNGLSSSGSGLLSKYLKGFKLNASLTSQISTLGISSIKELENCMELIIPAPDRKLNGAFFTPDYIIDFIIKEIKPQKKDSNFDPSCGCGAFLVGIAEYYKKSFNQSIRKTVKENIFGSDILEYNIRRTKLILAIYALQDGEILETDDFNLWHKDSLKTRWKRKFDNIIGNPPYVKFQDLSSESRKSLPMRWNTTGTGNFNLYFAFFELGHQLLRSAGKLAFITPNHYFSSIAGESLRSYFHEYKCVNRIIDFSHRKVFDANTYTAITFLDKRPNESIVFDRIGEDKSPAVFLANTGGSLNWLDQLDKKKWRLLKNGEKQNISNIETAGTPLGILLEISAGIATLRDEIYFIDAVQEKNGYYIKHTDKGKFLIEKEITKAVYKISDFKKQEETKFNTRRIICPYHIKNGMAFPIAENEFKKEFPECYRYFLSEKKALLTRDKGKVNFDPFFVWGRTQGLTKFGKKILTPTFSRYPRFLMTGQEHSYFTNGYGISAKTDKLDQMGKKAGASLWGTENMDIVQTILNSIVMQYYITKTSVAINGGYPCYQKNFIENFTIPQFSDRDLKIIRSFRDPKEIDEFLVDKYRLNLSE
jgi:adenine-specific DNA-methyltransferase